MGKEDGVHKCRQPPRPRKRTLLERLGLASPPVDVVMAEYEEWLKRQLATQQRLQQALGSLPSPAATPTTPTIAPAVPTPPSPPAAAHAGPRPAGGDPATPSIFTDLLLPPRPGPAR